jgi:hypothetical protein
MVQHPPFASHGHLTSTFTRIAQSVQLFLPRLSSYILLHVLQFVLERGFNLASVFDFLTMTARSDRNLSARLAFLPAASLPLVDLL